MDHMMNKKSLKKEIKKMKEHRKLYKPALEKFLKLFRDSQALDEPMEITGPDELKLVVELLDLGYLEKRAFTMLEDGNSFVKILYHGSYPLTFDGESIVTSD